MKNDKKGYLLRVKKSEEPLSSAEKTFIKRSSFFQKVSKRKYRNPQGFATWEEFLIDSCSFVLARKLGSFDEVGQPIHLSEIMFNDLLKSPTDFPVYWLDKQLGQAFCQTDLPQIQLLKVDKDFIPSAIFIPDGLLESPGGKKVRWIVFSFYSQGEVKKLITKDKTWVFEYPNDALQIMFLCDPGAYHSTLSFLPFKEENRSDYKQMMPQKKIKNGEHDGDAGSDFIANASAIVIHCLLWLRQNHQEGLSQSATIRSGVGFGKEITRASFSSLIFDPFWIGKNYQIKRNDASDRKPKKHFSSSTTRAEHWRRGHYRMQRVGKGRSGIKQIWIEPMLINSVEVPT